MRLSGRQIVCVGTADWRTELPINQHQLMRRLAVGNEVLFVESLGLRRPQLAGRDLRRIWRRLGRGLRGPRAEDGLHVLSPLVLPFHGSGAARTLNKRLLRLQVGRAARGLGLRRPILWAYAPQAEDLVAGLDPSLTIYHCVDDLAAQKGVDAEGFRAAEARFAESADLIIASSPALAERMRTLNPHVLYAPNVADTPAFATALDPGPVDAAIDALPRPRLVFCGAIVATKLDLALLADLARSRPDWSVALVGPEGAGDPGGDLSSLHRAPNIHLLGARPVARLPEVLRGADAGLIPYLVNDLTRSVFPMKVYEYMGAGLPVLATPLPALEGVEGVTTVADAGALVAAAESAFAADSPEVRRERSRLAGGHSWESRIEEIEAALGG
ncbi:MAG TPA: glycosyltransferase [Solirubrobacterales bacterium]|nr:glycosyltransferase [Solirubrobacterales bacterium]